ncbi:class I SAM-dependent methyltransferase [Aciditerrimonas ferrireducens]|uniref:class I SAM-dependent methyltransferase n=1 Tax=Aciditerrimonas ferrireducens TaxID=667306 RepID=UPI0020035FCD|nr:class I SAM-dependent methyltransferase [Aciditerrimonas ferrireducens]MCK4176820.1 class I SAM-dependent methyltransferase [Aciditerrimonas ferrireducens]
MAPAATPEARAAHWRSVYTTRPPTSRSWYQAEPRVSLALLDALGVGPQTAVLDVGGGASFLADRLVARGFRDVTVLDVAEEALAEVAGRLGGDPRVTLLCSDLLAFAPTRRYGCWHDRAVLHFLTEDELPAYQAVLRRALDPGGAVVVGAFAPDGPEQCSGLPVRRYDPPGLLAALGPGFEAVASEREEHRTPTGAVQPFAWLAARRTG